MLRLRRAAVVCLLPPNSLAIPACGSSADSSSHCLSRLSRLTQLDASRRLWFFRTPLSAVAAKKINVFVPPMRPILLALLPLLIAPGAALAQKEIPKAPGHNQCPLGYVNTLGTTCVSPIYYEVAPTNGEACKSGWVNISAGYCKKKKGPLGIL
jgi:hypothetical protein